MVFQSIIMSSRLYIQQQAYVKQILILPRQYVQQQAYVKQILLLLTSKQYQYLFDICLLLNVQS